MQHDTPLISTIVAGLVLAFIFGAVANRFRMPPLVGYLIAGVAVGPFTPGFVADTEIATELSEIGVILLMFGVGLNFSLRDLVSVQGVAIPGALLRIVGGTLMGLALGLFMGWSIAGGLVFGLALSVASTVVLLKALQDRHLVDSERGRIAVGWVIVEDVAMVLALVLIPALVTLTGASTVELHDPFVSFFQRMTGVELGLPGVLAVTVIKLAAFIGFMLIVGRRLIPMVLHFTAHTGSRELFRLAVLAIALGVAAGAAYLFGVSLALGAFFAGMILSESELSHRAAQESLPLRDAFSVLFFVSVGMLFDPTIILTNPLPALAVLFIILIGKSFVGFMLVVAFGKSISTALTVTAGVAQIGEFSFILIALGMDLGIMPPEAQSLVLSGAILSIVLNPVVFWAAERIRPALESRFPHKADETPVRQEPELAPIHAPKPAPPEDGEVVTEPTQLSGHTVLIGYGRIGTVVGDGLQAVKAPLVVVEDAEGRINAARSAGIEVVIGNAASPKVLNLANVAGAKTVIVAIPNAFEAGQAVEQCRKQNPSVVIIARAHSDEEEQHLLNLGANTVILGEREIGMGMLELVNRDSSAVAEITAADAVASALGTLAPAPQPAEPSPDPEVLLEAVETPPVQHADAGPAEPPAVVSAYGEEPDAPAEPVPAAPVVPDSLPYKARQPARTPATPFNPEIAPPEPAEN